MKKSAQRDADTARWL